MDNYKTQTERKLNAKGRIVTGWWDGQPIHREMTITEKAEKIGMRPDALALGILLLGQKDYKPTYPQD